VAAPRAAGCHAPLGLDVVPVGDGRSGSTVVLARVHGRLLGYVADEDAARVRIFGIDPPSELGSVAVQGRPARMVMLPGGRLAVALRDQARVEVFVPSPIGETGLDPICTLQTPDEPVDLAATPDGKTLLALSDWGHALTGFDLETGEAGVSIDLPRSPRAVLTSADGSHAYVAHAAGGTLSTIDLREPLPVARSVDLRGESTDRESFVAMMPRPDVEFFDGPTGQSIRRRRDRPPFRSSASKRERTACQGFALAEVMGPVPRVLAPMVEVVTGDLEAPSSGYGVGSSTTAELPVVAALDASKGEPIKGSLTAHEPDAAAPPPCLLPRAAAVRPGSLFVACMGIDAVVEYDTSGEGGETPERRRWSVPSGPTGLALHGQEVLVWSQFDREATLLSLSPEAKAPATRVPAKVPEGAADLDTLALGRRLFHASNDRRISKDGRACASCHPNGRDDGLVWSTPGGPRQTPMLAGRLPDTAPYGWDGAGSDVSQHLGHTLTRLEGQGLPARELDALALYVTTLEGPPVRTGTPGRDLTRGREVFFSAGCGSCHSVDRAWTDGQSHDVGVHAPADTVATFDTPSLRFVGGTAPYFHDGRSPTLRALLASQEGPMGAARSRPPADLDALEAFVRSL